jgi:hypothetical protein
MALNEANNLTYDFYAGQISVCLLPQQMMKFEKREIKKL